MITKITDFKNSLNSNEIIIYINTTGINQNKNHIYMVNILDGSDNKLKQYLSINNETESELIKFIFENTIDKKIISFNGKNYDLNFLNKKAFNLNLNKRLENYFDIFLFLKNYIYLKEKPKNIDGLYNTLNPDKETKKVDTKKLKEKYKKLDKLKVNSLDYKNILEELFSFGKDGIIKRYFLLNYLIDNQKTNSKTIYLFDEKFSYYIYNYKFFKDFLKVSLKSLDNMPLTNIDIINKYHHIYTKDNELIIKFNILKDKLSLKDYGICIYSNLKIDNLIAPIKNLKDNLILISINDKFIIENLEKTVYSALINI